MKYMIMGGHLDIGERQKNNIRAKGDNRAKEQLFKGIAKKKVLPAEDFVQIKSPRISQSIPFDFIATKNQNLALIEMKGADKDFNISRPTQFARLFWVVEALKDRGIKPNLFLLQLNLTYGVYQILTQKFYDLIFKGVKDIIKKNPNIGKRKKIEPILKIIDDYYRKYLGQKR